MSLDLVLTIAGVAASVGGLVAVLAGGGRERKQIVIAAVLAFLAATTTVLVLGHLERRQVLRKTEREVVGLIDNSTRTIDDLYHHLLNVPLPVISEALQNLIEQGRVSHRILELRTASGEFVDVRGYSLRAGGTGDLETTR